MILLKLALRNVRRQIGDYLVYFVTVACTVSLLFALCSMMFSELIFNFSAAFKMETRIVSAFLAVVLAVTVATVTFCSWRTAGENPADSVKSE